MWSYVVVRGPLGSVESPSQVSRGVVKDPSVVHWVSVGCLLGVRCGPLASVESPSVVKSGLHWGSVVGSVVRSVGVCWGDLLEVPVGCSVGGIVGCL